MALPETSPLDTALIRIIGEPPTAPLVPLSQAPATSVNLGPAQPVTTAALGAPQPVTPEPPAPVSSYDTMMAAKGRYETAKAASSASVPAGAAPLTYEWHIPATGYGFAPGAVFQANKYTAPAMQDPALFAARETARKDYETANAAYSGKPSTYTPQFNFANVGEMAAHYGLPAGAVAGPAVAPGMGRREWLGSKGLAPWTQLGRAERQAIRPEWQAYKAT